MLSKFLSSAKRRFFNNVFAGLDRVVIIIRLVLFTRSRVRTAKASFAKIRSLCKAIRGSRDIILLFPVIPRPGHL